MKKISKATIDMDNDNKTYSTKKKSFKTPTLVQKSSQELDQLYEIHRGDE